MSNIPPNVPGDQQGGAWGSSPPPPPPPQGPPPAYGQPPYGQQPYAQPYGQPGYGQQPPPGGSLPPFGQYGSSQPNAMAPMPGNLAEWPQRALAWLIDLVFYLVPWVIFWILALAANSVVFELLGSFIYLGLAIWFAAQLGQYGSTPGMRVMGLRCVSLKTGQPLGAGMGIVRWLCHVAADILCVVPFIVDMLFPLWDAQKQTLADKIVGSVVITVPKQPFSLIPSA